jgi:hypothetical protein
VRVECRDGGVSFSGLHRKYFGAVRHEVSVTLVWGFHAGHRRLGEARRRQVTVVVGVEGVDVQYVDAIGCSSVPSCPAADRDAAASSAAPLMVDAAASSDFRLS